MVRFEEILDRRITNTLKTDRDAQRDLIFTLVVRQLCLTMEATNIAEKLHKYGIKKGQASHHGAYLAYLTILQYIVNWSNGTKEAPEDRLCLTMAKVFKTKEFKHLTRHGFNKYMSNKGADEFGWKKCLRKYH